MIREIINIFRGKNLAQDEKTEQSEKILKLLSEEGWKIADLKRFEQYFCDVTPRYALERGEDTFLIRNHEGSHGDIVMAYLNGASLTGRGERRIIRAIKSKWNEIINNKNKSTISEALTRNETIKQTPKTTHTKNH